MLERFLFERLHLILTSEYRPEPDTSQVFFKKKQVTSADEVGGKLVPITIPRCNGAHQRQSRSHERELTSPCHDAD